MKFALTKFIELNLLRVMKLVDLIFLVVFLVGCSELAEQSRPNWDFQNNAIIYGEDNQREIKDLVVAQGTPKRFTENIAATFAIVDESHVKIDEQTGKATLLGWPLSKGKKLCDQEKFRDQLGVAFCSGVLVDKSRVLTAGHCISNHSRCDRAYFIRDFENMEPHDGVYEISLEKLFHCRKFVKKFNRKDETAKDFAIVTLDRIVDNISPVSVATTNGLHRGQMVYSFSFPNGVPKKFTEGSVMGIDPQGFYGRAELDTFGGSSGAPVFDSSTNELLGVLTGGEEDYEFDEVKACYKSRICKEGSCSGEYFLKVNRILDRL